MFRMPKPPTSVVVAILATAHGAGNFRTAQDLDTSDDKHIGGVPIKHYDQAYKGNHPSVEASASASMEDWVFVLKPQATDEDIGDMCSMAAGGCFQRGHHGGFPFLAVRGTESDLALAVNAHGDLMQYIQPDLIVPLEPEPVLRPKVKSEQEPKIWGLERIGAYKNDLGGRGVHVFVADTGIRTNHEDFAGRALPFVDVFIDSTNGTNLCANSPDPTCSTDRHGHGTHCASTVAGVNYGVAPEAKVYAVKVLSDQGSGSTAGILAGLDLVNMHGQRPAVVSMSLGGSRTGTAYDDAINVLFEAGITVVVAAGNDYRDACTKSPAHVPAAITVGATAEGDVRSGFSNFGTCVDIWAPGSDIMAADGSIATNTSFNYTSLSGTSMACPHVSGAVALLLEADPNRTPTQILDKLLADASINYIEDLSPNDTNSFLYVGNDGPQPAQPNKSTDAWPPQSFFQSCEVKGQVGPMTFGPINDYVCHCGDYRTTREENCYNGWELGCPMSKYLTDVNPAYPDIDFSHYYSQWNCTTCQCYKPGEEPSPPTEEPQPTTTTLAEATTTLPEDAGNPQAQIRQWFVILLYSLYWLYGSSQ